MFSDEGIRKAFEKIFLGYGFEFPMSFVLVGINGTFLTGRFEVSFITKKFRTTVVSGKANKLRFPINAMIVDAKGKVAHIEFVRKGGQDENTNIDIWKAKSEEGLKS
ncbi:MAG: hypothetical protein FJ130_05240 [Deltaproteobacteria bacterium]|nr:hypothetical protein [Deltaproteobacteria bacterium]